MHEVVPYSQHQQHVPDKDAEVYVMHESPSFKSNKISNKYDFSKVQKIKVVQKKENIYLKPG
jgi:hypothetical protein